jgi:hypothetical protein
VGGTRAGSVAAVLGRCLGKTIPAGIHQGHQLPAGTAVGSPLLSPAGYSGPAELATLEKEAERQATGGKLLAARPGVADRLRMSSSVLVRAPSLWGLIGPCAQALLAGARVDTGTGQQAAARAPWRKTVAAR